MKLPYLQITNTNALIGIQQHRATIEIKQPMAEIKMKQPQPVVEIDQSKSELEIDQTEAFADANLKHPFRVVNEWAAKAKQKVLQNISKKVSEGNRLMSIEHQQKSVIPQIAKEKSEPPPKEISIDYLPKPGNVKFHYQPSEIKIKVPTKNLDLEVQTHHPIIKFNPGDLQIYLRQKASIHIQAIGAALDEKI
ncbi:hypothetical protein BGM26_19860 [Bacillus sp. FJAT-29790]|uniref:DUF6470 family protein n=1 Tax=Bacillus sp. FJAT-29790 TaxID=1895002 RepID=UPI001C2443A4|nr:DUF6470 family protein [Bacillus sp. FJAT-29790]MBU8881183.1 hypothetical protein [Bacillus sp. FJAT-29790]